MQKASFSRVICVLMLGVLVGDVIAAGADSDVLVQGEPPLTVGLVAKIDRFFEWFIDARFTDAQKQAIQKELVAVWREGDKTKVKNATDVAAQFELIEKLDAATRDQIRQQSQAKAIEQWRAKKDDPMCQMLVRVYDEAHGANAAPKQEQVKSVAPGAFADIDAIAKKDLDAATAAMKDPARRKPGFAVGTVTDARGKPIKGATVVVSVFGTTIAGGRRASFSTQAAEDGTWSQRVPEGVYSVWARVEVKVGRKTLKYDCEPVDGARRFESWDSTAGIVRDFRWRITGLKPEMEANFHSNFYGGGIKLREPNVGGNGHNFGRKYPGGTIELVLTPRGPLVDGGEGRTYRCTCKSEDIDFLWAPEWWNIAMGPYTATATFTDAKGKARLRLAADGNGKFADSVDVDFAVQDEGLLPFDIYVSD